MVVHNCFKNVTIIRYIKFCRITMINEVFGEKMIANRMMVFKIIINCIK